MQNFLSFSSNPGTTGLRYYSYFFRKYGLDCAYRPLAVTDLHKAIDNAKYERASGFSVSMPFKRSVIDFLDEVDPTVQEYQSCNTVKIVDNKLYGYNTDLDGALAIRELYICSNIVTILGNGAMGTMFNKLIPGSRLISRSIDNWDARYCTTDTIINCTALGTVDQKSPFLVLPECKLVIDLALKENDLKLQCREKKVKYVSGIEFYKFNFLKQFEIYTGIKLDENEFEEV